MKRTARWVSMVAASTLAIAACGSDDDDDSAADAGEETTVEESTTTTVDEEAAVLDAYYASWEAFETASGNPVDPNHPALAETMTGDALEAVRSALRPLAERGEYFDGPSVEHSAEVRELLPDRAVVDDCASDPSVAVAADGTPITESDPTPYAYEAVMVKQDGTWKRSELNQGDTCEP